MAITNLLQSLFSHLAPLHLLSFATLLGSQLYQSFIITKIAFKTLPSSAYTNFQKRIFPIYFRGQSALLLLTAITLPPLGPFSLAQQHKSDWIPFVVSGSTAALNFFLFGPRTRELMLKRVEQGRADSKTTDITGPSPAMAQLNRQFSRAHAMCIHLNLLSMGALVFYGWRLSSRLQY
ncbi:hypothetical protein BGZ63DRAFT_402864 [Mariannaea sp. PMI_226]|nr:hypothetical protein BGZ63DRAFT_402864 [Mariannaea sp. PMI_226]